MAKYSAKGTQIKHGTSATPTDVLAQVQTVGFNQGDRDQIDMTTHDSTVTMEHADSGLRETGELEFTIVYDPANAGHEAIRAAEAAGTLYYLTLVLPDAGNAQWAMSGHITKFNIPPRAPKDPLIANVTFKSNAADTFTA